MSQPEAEADSDPGERPAMRRLRRADDNYSFVLIAILVTLVAMGVVSETAIGRLIIPLLFLGIFFLTLVTSAVPRRTIVILTVVIPVVLAVGGVATASKLGSAIGSLSPLVSAALAIACVVFIFRRLSTHVVITRQTIFGSLCIYLFGALLFALVYIAIAAISGNAFFVQTEDPSAVDYIYFSFITIATVGFGDLSPVTDVGRMAVVVEAVVGQLYLVVVVALFVSRIGRKRMDRTP